MCKTHNKTLCENDIKKSASHGDGFFVCVNYFVRSEINIVGMHQRKASTIRNAGDRNDTVPERVRAAAASMQIIALILEMLMLER